LIGFDYIDWIDWIEPSLEALFEPLKEVNLLADGSIGQLNKELNLHFCSRRSHAPPLIIREARYISLIVKFTQDLVQCLIHTFTTIYSSCVNFAFYLRTQQNLLLVMFFTFDCILMRNIKCSVIIIITINQSCVWFIFVMNST